MRAFRFCSLTLNVHSAEVKWRHDVIGKQIDHLIIIKLPERPPNSLDGII